LLFLFSLILLGGWAATEPAAVECLVAGWGQPTTDSHN